MLKIVASVLAMLACAFCQSAFASTAGPTPTLSSVDAEAWLDGFMTTALRDGEIAGAVVVIVKDGTILVQKGYGYSDVAHKRPVDPQTTLFRPASITKTFTATAAMQLVEQGKLNLDTNINSYLDFKVDGKGGKPITLRNLLQHTAGFQEIYRGYELDEGDPVMSLETYVKSQLPARVYAPGTMPSYSNYGASLVGYIVQRVSKERYDDYVERHILAPLGIKYGTLHQPIPAALRPFLTLNYDTARGTPQPVEVGHDTPAGSLAISGNGMARFMLAHMQQGRFDGQQILMPQTVNLMHNSANRLFPKMNAGLLGFYENNINGHRVVSHAGGLRWANSDLNMYVDDGVGLFINTNSAGKGNIIGDIHTAFANRYFPDGTKDGTVSAAQAARDSALVAGRYGSSRSAEESFMTILKLAGQVSLVPQSGGGLAMDILGTKKFYRQIAPLLWREVDGHDMLAAKIEKGNVQYVMMNSSGGQSTLIPIAWWQSGIWLMPAFFFALIVFLIAAIKWPLSYAIRKYYRTTTTVSPSDRPVTVIVFACLAALAAWLVVLSKATSLPMASNWMIYGAQLLSIFAFIGAVLVTVGYTWAVFRSPSSRWRKTWAVALLSSSIILVWIGIVFRLLQINASY
jgi:CubicO group peptidase (beta-lactamase class C family)